MAFNQTPSVKFENSPAESLLSSPSEMYPSLFGSEPVSSTMNPLEIMTPQSYDEDVDMSALTDLAGGEKNELTSSPSGEKKPVKKRKSWGQVLPEPKTNLPPRKRAKTEDEKEQRRVERVLRNRRAAQSSRERKRQEVEALEIRNAELEAQVRQLQQAQLLLVEELQKSRRNSGVVTRTPTSFDSLRSTPVTFSQELFSSQDSHSASLDSSSSSIEDLLTSVTTHTTVNPASLSPALTPVPEAEDEDEPATSATPLAAIAAPVNASPDATQHPAVSVGGSTTVVAEGFATPVAPGAGSVLAAPASVDFNLGDAFSLPTSFDADRYVLESGLLASPNSLDLEYDHLAGDDTTAFNFPAHNATFDFDITEFLNDEQNVASNDLDSSLLDPETQVSQKDPNLQPHSGASSYGCDDGGIAVGVN